ncbi:MAG: PGF-CTERM sorting domain-containing protein [Euryarchaeota archaeon]|nr:PGF-CTERM sorting domain-containing protein [Euryarchaeota archaeon]
MIAVPVQVAASEESVCADATLVWGERVAIEGYVFEVTDFSVGRASEIRLGESVWALVTVYKNDSAVWREVFSTNETAIDYAYNANESSYTFDLNCTETYIENGTDRIRVHASKIVIGSNPPIQSITIQACIIEPPVGPISFGEWLNNTFSVTKSASKEVYVREQVFIELKITNLSVADRVVVTDSITDEFVVDPDRDLYWDYSRDTYRYSITPLVPGMHTLPVVNVSVWCKGWRINITSDTPEVTVQGPYVTVTKTEEHADGAMNVTDNVANVTGGVVNVTVSACNEGTHAAMVYVFDSIPDGAELINGTLGGSMVLNPASTEHTSEYVNTYTIKINETVTLPSVVVYYQTARQIDLARDYKPAATFELEKYINPKFYSARARSSEILIRYGADVDAAAGNATVNNATADATSGTAADAPVEAADTTSEAVSDEAPGETGESQPATDGDENNEKEEGEENEEENGLMDKIKAMPGFTSIFAIIGLLSGYLILRFGSQNS